MFGSVLEWLDSRTGIVSGVKKFFDEQIPASSGWHQVFGSVALFILATQFATGVLLALNFAPQPGVSYLSVEYIVSQIPAGGLIRGLHHWGASMMVIFAVLHMVQVAIWGAYKKPREMTWIIGVLLLLLILGFGLTGYLLPWDNRAYWATVVSIQIAGLPPGGAMVQSIMGSPDGQVGIGTFQRFYALHVIVLPAITVTLALFHLLLVRKHGAAPQPGDEAKPPKKFYPEQVWRDTTAIFGAFALLFAVAALADVPMEKLADPQDTSYIPRPEWYFLFLFQFLKLFEGPLEVFGAVVLPTLAIVALMLVPFFDQGKVRRASQRFAAIAVVGLAALVWSGLTVTAIVTTPNQEGVRVEASGEERREWSRLAPLALAGLHEFREQGCLDCHNLANGEPKVGATLASVSQPLSVERMREHLRNRAGEDLGLTNTQAQSLVALVSSVTPENGSTIENAPELPVFGASVYASNSCSACHVANGQGRSIGPPLNGVGRRRDAEWLVGHFRDPTAFTPGSTMPPYDLPDPQMEALVAYVTALPE